MSDAGYTVEWVGWCKDGTSDKIWGYIRLNCGTYYNFWCKRGGVPRFKRHDDNWTVRELSRSKHDQGYAPQTGASMEVIWVGFAEALENAFIIAKFSGNIMTDKEDSM